MRVFISDILALFIPLLINNFFVQNRLNFLIWWLWKKFKINMRDKNRKLLKTKYYWLKYMLKNNHIMIELSIELLFMELRSASLSSPETSLLMILLALLRTYNVFLAVSLCWVISGGSHKLSIKVSFFNNSLYNEYCISYWDFLTKKVPIFFGMIS